MTPLLQLTHQAIWLEGELNDIITGYFCRTTEIQKYFGRLILFRDGLTAQDKIEIVRGMLPLFEISDEDKRVLKSLLSRIVEFKSWRNAVVHGMDVTGGKFEDVLEIEVVNRAGRERLVKITPQSHREKLEEADTLLRDIRAAKETILGIINVA